MVSLCFQVVDVLLPAALCAPPKVPEESTSGRTGGERLQNFVAGSSGARGCVKRSPLSLAASCEAADLTYILCNPFFCVAFVTTLMSLHSHQQPDCFKWTLSSQARSCLPFWHHKLITYFHLTATE